MQMKKIRWFVLCALALCFLIPAGIAERAIPDALKVTQEVKSYRAKGYRIITYSELHSAREDVDDVINGRVAALKEEAEAAAPEGTDFNKRCAHADIYTQITRTGDRWLSFHVCAQTSAKSNQNWVKCEDYTYDMESGRLIRLGDIICEDGWEKLLHEIRTQVEESFPEDKPDEKALDAICSRESLTESGFVMTPGHLALFFPAADVYPAHAEALLRVEIYVPELREILTEEARKETDCTGYKLIALTYDDGPGKGTTRGVLSSSVRHPGQVTFFTTGHRLEENAEMLHLEFDAGHSVQSHSWAHATKGVTTEKLTDWETQYNKAMGSIIGRLPIMMRPPGGNWKGYVNSGSELAQILWDTNSTDSSAGEGKQDMLGCCGRASIACDGSIVLFHDVKIYAGDLAERSMRFFEQENMLIVTVNDLCALRGVSLKAGTVLQNCPPEEAEVSLQAHR